MPAPASNGRTDIITSVSFHPFQNAAHCTNACNVRCVADQDGLGVTQTCKSMRNDAFARQADASSSMQLQGGTYCKAANKGGHVVQELANLWNELLRVGRYTHAASPGCTCRVTTCSRHATPDPTHLLASGILHTIGVLIQALQQYTSRRLRVIKCHLQNQSVDISIWAKCQAYTADSQTAQSQATAASPKVNCRCIAQAHLLPKC